MQILARHWSLHAFDVTVKSNHVANNMTKSFNSKMNEDRSKSTLSLLKELKRYMMKKA